MLALGDARGPGLRDDDAIDSGHDSMRVGVNVVEIVQQADRLAGAHGGAALEQRLVVSGKRCRGKTSAINHRHALLRAIAVGTARSDFAAELAVVDGGGEHAVPRAAHALGIDGAAPAELGADGDLAEALGFGREQAGRQILVSHNERRAEPAGGFLGEAGQLGIVERVETGAERKARDVAAGVQVDDNVDTRPDVIAHERRDAVRDAVERRGFSGAVDEGAVEVHAVLGDGLARVALEGGRVEDRDKNDAAAHILGADFAEQVLQCHGAFDFVAMIGAKGDEPATGGGLGTDPDREREKMIAPDAVVFESDEVIAAAGRIEIKAGRTDDGAVHAKGGDWVGDGEAILRGRVPARVQQKQWPAADVTRFCPVAGKVESGFIGRMKFLSRWCFTALALVTSVLAADGATEFTTTASGLKYAVTTHGNGPAPQAGQVVIAHYTGTLADGTEFDSSRERDQPFAFTLGKKQVIKGWDEGFALLHVGDRATLVIPPELAYGEKARGKIPANATLTFDVELVDIKEHALADVLRETIDTAGLAAAKRRFAELKGNAGTYYLSEGQLNSLGYFYLMRDKTEEALAVFQWTVEAFPDSGNAYDSLGEAWVKKGDRATAMANYEKSLALDPKNENAEKMLKELKATEDGPAALAQMQARMELDTAMTAAFDAADKDVYDVPALHAKVAAFLEKYPEDRTAEGIVGNLFYYAESVGLAEARAEWQAFANHPNPKLKARAEQKLQVAELLKAPIEMSFTAADGRAVDVAKLRGKVVLIDFWAVWCGPCREEIPNVVAVYEKYHAQGFEVVGISFDRAPNAEKPWKSARTAAQVLAFTQEQGMPWPQFYDGSYWDNPYGKQYGIRGIPAMFLLDQTGMVVSLNARGPKLEKEVRRLLGLPALAAVEAKAATPAAAK